MSLRTRQTAERGHGEIAVSIAAEIIGVKNGAL